MMDSNQLQNELKRYWEQAQDDQSWRTWFHEKYPGMDVDLATAAASIIPALLGVFVNHFNSLEQELAILKASVDALSKKRKG